ncbi:MAG TPA: hypothetical protein VFU02_18855, partial [Polyangiaceae bacterium]|nr:hypothetical protein [Polyangiaceae bacterium]
MRLVQLSPSFLYAALLLGLAFGCSDDSGDGSESTSTTNATTTGTSTTGTSTTGTTGTTGTSTTGTATSTSTSVTNTASSTATATSTTGGDSSVPADSSAAAIAAFLEAEGYKESGWVSVHDAPVPPSVGTPHGTVRVYMSPALVAFRQSNPDLLEEPAVPGAMAVKEMYDGETIVGKAVTFYPADEVFYFCYGPDGRCASGRAATTIDAPEWG